MDRRPPARWRNSSPRSSEHAFKKGRSAHPRERLPRRQSLGVPKRRANAMLSPAEPDEVLFDIAERFGPGLTRRHVLRGAALAGVGLVGAGLAACGTRLYPALGTPRLSASPSASATASALASASAAPSATATATAAASAQASATAIPTQSPPAGWSEMDVAARQGVRRYIGNLAPALRGIYGDAAFTKLAGILGAAE